MQNSIPLSFNFKDIYSVYDTLDSFKKHGQPSESIKKVGVIGSGVMGSGIAGVLANSSIEVILLDIVSGDSSERSSIAKQAIEKLLITKPMPLTSPSRKNFIKFGNLNDDLKLLSDCDLIIEVIVEKIEVKQQLYEKIVPYLKKGAIIASNTSTLQLKNLKQNLPGSIRPHFLIIHFFNPPRYMELVELITDQETDPNTHVVIRNFITHNLGKIIVECNDTPGFIANRIGCFFLELVVRKTIKEKLDPVIIDNILTKLFKMPSTGVFGLYDLIGIDVLKLISSSLIKNLSSDDLYKNIYIDTPLIDNMIKANVLGRKTNKGFYHIFEIDGKKEKSVISFDDSENTARNIWQPIYVKISQHNEINNLFKSVEELLNSDSSYGKFFKEIMFEFYHYLFTLIPDVTEEISNIDQAMELGYSWKFGPFKLLANYFPGGLEWLENEAIARSIDLPNFQNNRLLKSIKSLKVDSSKVAHKDKNESEIFSNNSAKLYTYQNKLIVSIESKMCCLNTEVFELLIQSVNYAEKHNKDLYIYPSNSPHFSAGADLKFIIQCIENKDFEAIDRFIKLGQQALMALKNSNINVISCVEGAALGGGCEILLHSDFIISHSEIKSGLVELSLGLIPSWGGVKEMFLRSKGDLKLLVKNIGNIIFQNKSASADQFIADYQIVNHKIIMNKRDILEEACNLKTFKKVCPIFDKLILPQIILTEHFDFKKLDKLQINILGDFQKIINQKVIDTNDLLEFERLKFVELCKLPETLIKLQNLTQIK